MKTLVFRERNQNVLLAVGFYTSTFSPSDSLPLLLDPLELLEQLELLLLLDVIAAVSMRSRFLTAMPRVFFCMGPRGFS
jgi:hypothetical protein